MSRSPDPFLLLGNSAAKGSSAPKGRKTTAQGKALGNRPTTNPSPEGAAQEFSTDVSPQGWSKATFGELIRSVSINDKKLPAKQYAESGKFPVVDQGQKFIGGYSDDEHRVISDELPLIVFGDHTRIFKYLDRAFVPGADGIKVLKPIGVDAKWLFHIAHALDFPDKGYARHFQHLKQATVFVPPLPEQRRIVARIEELFSRLDAGVAALRHAKAQLQRYRQSVLAAAVTGQLTQFWREHHPDTEPAEELLKRILEQRHEQWDGRGKYKEPIEPAAERGGEIPDSWMWTSTDSVCSQITDGEHIQPRYQDEGLPMLSAKHVRDGYVILDGAGLISPEDFETCLKRCAPVKDDVLIVSVGATTGRTGIVGDQPPFALVRSVLLLRPFSILPRYLLLWNQSPWIMRWKASASGASAQPHLYIKDTRRMPLALPPLAEQHQIVAEVEARTTAIDHLETELDRQITRSSRLRQSTLASAFSGTI